jgi:hypothetical protein
MKNPIVMAFVALAGLASGSAAQATTTHWNYIVPGACGISPDGSSSAGSTAYLSGDVSGNSYGNTVSRIITCEIRLPQGATITAARVWGDDPRSSGHSIAWDISAIPYTAPDQPTLSFGGNSTMGTKTFWWSQTSSPLLIDNENNAYLFSLYIGGNIASTTRLVEITYAMP